MPCSATRQDVSNAVLDVVRAVQRDNAIVEATTFGQDIIVDSLARRNYASPIINTMGARFPGCPLSRFGPDDCARASRVKDIVDTVWNEVRPR
jgi:hypothetical protein